MGSKTYLIRKQNLPCSEPRTCNRKETILQDGDGSEIADYLTDCELLRCVEPNELPGEVQELLGREKLGSDNYWNRATILLNEELETVQDDRESEYELQLSY